MVPVASLARFTGNSYGLSDDTVEAAGCTRITNLGTKIVSNFFFLERVQARVSLSRKQTHVQEVQS
jgi:hypothetical protein